MSLYIFCTWGTTIGLRQDSGPGVSDVTRNCIRKSLWPSRSRERLKRKERWQVFRGVVNTKLAKAGLGYPLRNTSKTWSPGILIWISKITRSSGKSWPIPLCYDKQYFPLHRKHSGLNAHLLIIFPTLNVSLIYIVTESGPVMIAF